MLRGLVGTLESGSIVVQRNWCGRGLAIELVFDYTVCMQGITMDQVRATDVVDLAACLLGRSEVELLGADAETAEAMVAAAQRVISAMTAVQAVAIEAWGRRECEQLSVDKAEWQALAAAGGLANPGGPNGAHLRLLDGLPKDEHDFMPSYLAPVLRLSRALCPATL